MGAEAGPVRDQRVGERVRGGADRGQRVGAVAAAGLGLAPETLPAVRVCCVDSRTYDMPAHLPCCGQVSCLIF